MKEVQHGGLCRFCDEKARNGKINGFYTKLRSARGVSIAAHTGAPMASATVLCTYPSYIFTASDVHFWHPLESV